MKFNKLVPELNVSSLENSLDFYVNVLGFKVEYTRERFAFLSFQGSQLMLEEHTNWETAQLRQPFGRGVNFQITVKDVKPLLYSLQRRGCKLFEGLQDNYYNVRGRELGFREFLVQDPNGYLLRFSQRLKPAAKTSS